MQGHFCHMFLIQVFFAFSHVSLSFALYGSFFDLFLIVGNSEQPISIVEIVGYFSCHGDQNVKL